MLVADGDVFQVKGFRVPHCGAPAAPFAVRAAAREFDQVQDVLNPFIQLIHVRQQPLVPLAGHSCIHHGNRLCADILTELKVFVKAQPIGLEIILRGAPFQLVFLHLPAVPVGAAAGQIPDGLLPAVHILKASALYDTSPGKAHEFRGECGDHFRDVPAHAARALHKGVRGKKGEQVQIHGSVPSQQEMRVNAGACGACGKGTGIFCPAVPGAHKGKLFLGIGLSGGIREPYHKGHGGGVSGIAGKAEALPLPHGEALAAEAEVIDAAPGGAVQPCVIGVLPA